MPTLVAADSFPQASVAIASTCAGAYQGDDSDCSTSPCVVLLTGACCDEQPPDTTPIINNKPNHFKLWY